ncbi:MAG: M23 family metallopeptidase [Anaerolineaceae bacterium]
MILCILVVFALIQTVQADDLPSSTLTPNEATTQASPNPPLKLTFPEAADHPISSWRPSLFPIPYALSPHDHFYLNRPISVTSVNWPLPDYRYGYVDSSETESPHTGVDIDAPLHTPILAAGDGKVVFVGYGLALGGGNKADPYGLAVVIKHNFSFADQSLMTVYSHMEKITVKNGQTVKTGDQLGLVGMTGNTTGPHVHFEVRLEKDNTYTVQNPELWMASPTDCGVLVGQFKDTYGNYLTARTMTLQSEATGKTWTIRTYAGQTVRNDPYYAENLVLGDLPIGKYKITFLNNYHYYNFEVAISPGAITFISYTSGQGFSTGQPQKADSTSFLIPFHN